MYENRAICTTHTKCLRLANTASVTSDEEVGSSGEEELSVGEILPPIYRDVDLASVVTTSRLYIHFHRMPQSIRKDIQLCQRVH